MGYSGALLRTADGTPVAQWLENRGSLLLENHEAALASSVGLAQVIRDYGLVTGISALGVVLELTGLSARNGVSDPRRERTLQAPFHRHVCAKKETKGNRVRA